MKYGLYVIGVMLLVGLAFAIGASEGKKAAALTMKPQVDTLVIRDTLRVTEPVEIAHTVIREKTVEIPVYISTKDTVIQKVYIPREERIYKDSAYFAVVSGVEPKLDYLEVYPKTTTVTRTETVWQTTKPRWGIGIQGGYGIGKAGLTPYIGVGLQYNIISFGRRQF